MSEHQEICLWEDKLQIREIKEIYGRNLTPGEFNIFVQTGRATGLNPFLREIWAVKYGNNAAQIFIGRDGYRKSAQAHRQYDYHHVDSVYTNDDFHFDLVKGEVTHTYNVKDRGKLIGAYGLVKKKDASKPTFVFVEFAEYNTNQSLWRTKPATMIKKVAEAQVLRMAFQALFAGTYAEEEFSFDQSRRASNTKAKELNQKLGLIPKEPEVLLEDKKEPETYDHDTGEVLLEESENNHDEFSADEIRTKMSLAKSINELIESVDLVNMLPSSQMSIKKELMQLYRQRQKELG